MEERIIISREEENVSTNYRDVTRRCVFQKKKKKSSGSKDLA
jgi:hypothetical protein